MTYRVIRAICNFRASFATAKMIAAFFPLKKLRRNGKHLLLGAILLVGAVAVYHEMAAAKSPRSHTSKFVIYHIIIQQVFATYLFLFF